MKRFIFYLIFIISLSFSQNIWGNGSAATSDDLNAFEFNPAGLAINHGKMTGFYIQPDEEGKFSRDATFYDAMISNGFGIMVGANKNTKLFRLKTYPMVKIGTGFKIYKDLNYGFSVDNKENMMAGLLWRPHKMISLGATESYTEFKNYHSTTLGVAFRPLSTHRLTIGLDYKSFHGSDIEAQLNPFIELHPVKGMKLSISKSEINSEDTWNINLGFTFDPHSELYVSNKRNVDTDFTASGIGMVTSNYKKEPFITPVLNRTKGKNKNIIKLKLEGTFIEEPPKIPPFIFDFNIPVGPFNFGSGDNTPGIQLRTWINKIDEYTSNKNIDGMVIHLGQVNAGFSKRQEIRNALMRFKESGKKIYVYCNNGTWIGNTGYYMISMANEIYMHEQNSVYLTGLSANFMFFKDFFDKFDITPVVYRVNKDGKSYKGAVDTFLNSGISEEMKEEYNKILDDLYYVFVRDISEARGWDPSKTENAIDNGPYLVAEQAIEAELITATMYPDEFDHYIKNLNNKKVDFIDFDPSDNPEYLYAWKESETPNIAIIYAVGGIVSGKSNPGPKGSSIMGDETIIKAFKDAYENENVDAVILRIDSGGGSALASDMMWRQMVKSREDSTNNKPFIVSMSDVAASGGYYIAAEADKIVANETTITGSIGVISFWPNFSKLMNKYGINFDDSIRKGEHSNFKYINLTNRLHNDYEKEKIQESLNDIYDKFKIRVVNGRDGLNDIDELDNIALGRIWTGAGGKNVFLVDEVGGLNKAIEVTKDMLEISQDAVIRIDEYPKIYSNELAFDFGEEKEITISSDLLPPEMSDDIDLMEILPVLYSDDMLMILPYRINVE